MAGHARPLGTTADRIVQLRSLVEGGSSDPEVFRELAGELADSNEHAEAASVLRSCLTRSLSTFERAAVMGDLASLLFSDGRTAETEELAQAVRSLLALEPDLQDVLILRALNESLIAHCVWATRPEAVREVAQSALNSLELALAKGVPPEDLGVVYSAAANVCSLLERQEQVIEFCRSALQHELAPHDRLSCLTCLAEALRATGMSAQALDTVDEALALTPPGDNAIPLLHLTRGLALRDAGRKRQAWQSLYEALVRAEAHPFLCRDFDMVRTLYSHLSHLAATRQDHEETALLLSRLLRKYSPEAEGRGLLLVWIGDCHAMAGAHEKARHYYQQVLTSRKASDTEKDEARRGLSTLPPTRRRSH